MPEKKFTEAEEILICWEYLNQKAHPTLEKLARKYDCAVGTIHTVLEEHNIPRRGRGKDKVSRLKKNTAKTENIALDTCKK